jgi:hypothetical protein
MKLLYVAFFALLLSCNQEEEPLEMQDAPAEINYSELGNLIVNQSQKALGTELKAALQRGGVAEAVNYCNLKAIPLTDSLARFYNVIIKRATQKARNPLNMANQNEGEIAGVWETKQENNGEISPVLFEGENAVEFYSPIVLQSMCTNCHGIVGESLSLENNQLIKDKYPNDLATGYAEGDLRGMWHVTFKK